MIIYQGFYAIINRKIRQLLGKIAISRYNYIECSTVLACSNGLRGDRDEITTTQIYC